MRINTIQNHSLNSNTNFKMKILPNVSVKNAVLTSRELMWNPKEQDREFVQEFCSSLVRILKSNQADRIWTTTCVEPGDKIGASYVKEIYQNGESKEVLWLKSIQEQKYRFGHMGYSQEGGNIMRTLIKYAQTIKDVPEQRLNLTDEELTDYAYKLIGEDLHNSIGGFYYV